MDLLYLFVIAALVALTWAFLRLCAQLSRKH